VFGTDLPTSNLNLLDQKLSETDNLMHTHMTRDCRKTKYIKCIF
jgi:hypothetical protein